ncbi:MAG: CvpA family protein [Clostridia bacterium]|nr:CvpA family protein [Clostridia bacterium]
MILDLIAAAIVVLSFIVNLRRGLVKSVWKITALVLTIVLVIALKTPVVNYLAGTDMANRIYKSVSDSLTAELENPINEVNTDEEAAQSGTIPPYLMEQMLKTVNSDSDNINSAIEKGMDELARRLTMLMLKIIAVIGLFIIIRILLMVVFIVLDGASKLPVIGHANALLGGILGIINALAIIYIVCAVLSLLSVSSDIQNLINQSYIVKYFYNYNILLQLIMKI